MFLIGFSPTQTNTNSVRSAVLQSKAPVLKLTFQMSQMSQMSEKKDVSSGLEIAKNGKIKLKKKQWTKK